MSLKFIVHALLFLFLSILFFLPYKSALGQNIESTIQGTVIITQPAKMDINVVLQQCNGDTCSIVRSQALHFDAQHTEHSYSFSISPGTYRVALLKQTDEEVEFIYIFSNASHYQRSIYVTDCNPNGIVRDTIQGQQCEIKDYGIAGFAICTDTKDNCMEKDLIQEYQENANNAQDQSYTGVTECNIDMGKTSCRLNTGLCSVCNLERYFTDSPTKSARQKAIEASQICQGESGGNPFAINRGCMRGGAREYSVGLFQINLLWRGRCPQEARAPLCSEQDTLLLACRDFYFGPANNIAKMLSMSGNGANWRPWTVARKCGLTR